MRPDLPDLRLCTLDPWTQTAATRLDFEAYKSRSSSEAMP